MTKEELAALLASALTAGNSPEEIQNVVREVQEDKRKGDEMAKGIPMFQAMDAAEFGAHLDVMFDGEGEMDGPAALLRVVDAAITGNQQNYQRAVFGAVKALRNMLPHTEQEIYARLIDGAGKIFDTAKAAEAAKTKAGKLGLVIVEPAGAVAVPAPAVKP